MAPINRAVLISFIFVSVLTCKLAIANFLQPSFNVKNSFSGSASSNAIYLPDPASIVAFWPLDRINGLDDVSGLHRPSKFQRAAINLAMLGPFGINETCISADTSSARGYLFESRFRAPSPSFSVSFAFFAGEDDSGILTTAMTCNGLSFHYSAKEPPSLVLSTGNFPATKIAEFAVFKKLAWNFITVTYDALNHQLVVLGEHKMLAYSPYEPAIAQLQRFENGVLVGFSCYEGHTHFRADCALSCLAIHDRAVTLTESQKLFEACRQFHVKSIRKDPIAPDFDFESTQLEISKQTNVQSEPSKDKQDFSHYLD